MPAPKMTAKLRLYAQTATFAALIAVLSQIAVPIGQIPLSLGLVGVFLATGTLPDLWGMVAVAVYVTLGCLGVPVFYGFNSVSALVGPTGGFVVGYVACAAVVGAVKMATNGGGVKLATAMAVGLVACYSLGVAWFCLYADVSPVTAICSAVLPYVPFDVAKIAVSCVLVKRLKTALKFD